MTIATVPSATSVRRSDMPERTGTSCELAMRSTSRHGRKTRGAGARHSRKWNPITVVTLNPERDTVIKAATENLHNAWTAA